MAPGANIGEDGAVFEAVHGSAPDIAGRNMANPIALVLSGAMMLDHLGEHGAADRVRAAVNDVLRDGRKVTRDLGGGAGTTEVAEAIAARV
jgi:isocitrate dehydrogenase (NAD+)